MFYLKAYAENPYVTPRMRRVSRNYLSIPKHKTKERHASQEARELAESLGYDLEANETYVRPFIKQVFRLKEKDRG